MVSKMQIYIAYKFLGFAQLAEPVELEAHALRNIVLLTFTQSAGSTVSACVENIEKLMGASSLYAAQLYSPVRRTACTKI